MKITDVQACVVGRWEMHSGGSVWTFVRIYTDSGIVGTGECNSAGQFGAPFMMKQIVLGMKPMLVGEDPMRIGYLYEKLRRRFRYSGATTAPTIFAITEDVLDLDDLLSRITLPTTGAACLFTGMVRGVTQRGEAHDTLYLEYQAYQSMAEAKMRQVADEIRARWPNVEGIAIVQRIGRLYPGTPTVLIACTSAHRDTGVFEAARYGIDRLKEIVPVWKKEVDSNGESWVEGEYIPKPDD